MNRLALVLLAACTPPAHPAASPPAGIEGGEAVLATAHTPADIQQLCDRSKQMLASLAEHAATASGHDLVHTLEDIDRRLWIAQGTADLFAETNPDEGMRNAARACVNALDPTITKLETGPVIAHLAAVHDLPAAEQRFADRVVANAKLSGAGLSPSDASALAALLARENELTAAMAEALGVPPPPVVVERGRLAGMPASFIATHAPEPSGKVALDPIADYRDVATYAQDRALASEILSAQNVPGAPNAARLRDLLAIRKQIAMTLGCRSYVECRARTRMVGTPERTEAFYRDLLVAMAEPDAMYRAALRLPTERPPEPDLRFLENQLRERAGIADPTPWLSYFEVEPTFDRVLTAVTEATGLRFAPVDVPVWSRDVRVFDVFDASGKLGRFYFDLYMRPGKAPGGGSTIPFVPHTPGHTNEPVAVAVVLGISRATSGPTLFRPASQLPVFLHELGHAIDFLYETRSELAPPEADYFDVISQLFEFWAPDPELLQRLGRKDGQPLPPDGARAISNELRWANWNFVRYVTFLGMLDLAYHGDTVPPDLVATYADAYAKVFPTRASLDNHPEGSLYIPTIGYAGNGHALPWGLAIATDLAGELHGFFDRATWRRLITEVLSSDGPAELRIERFLGRPWKLDRLRAQLAPPLAP